MPQGGSPTLTWSWPFSWSLLFTSFLADFDVSWDFVMVTWFLSRRFFRVVCHHLAALACSRFYPRCSFFGSRDAMVAFFDWISPFIFCAPIILCGF